MDYRVVYTVSDTSDLIPYALTSIKSLEKFVPKENVIVFYTPPRSEKNYRRLSDVAKVQKVDNISKPFKFLGHGFRYYGEKIRLCDVDCPNVMFLDADTLVKKDIAKLLEGDYDFSAYPPVLLNEDSQAIDRLFEGRKRVPMFNTGFLIFKNNLHKKIKDAWLKYTNDENLLSHPQFALREQWALSLALSEMLSEMNIKIKAMTFEQFTLEWRHGLHTDTFAVHRKNKTIYKRFRNWFGMQRRRFQEKLRMT